MTETGVVEPGDAVVAPGPVRITSVRPLVGAPSGPGEEIAAATGTGHGVHVDLDRRYRALAVAERAVRVRLFGGRSVDGVITEVGTSAAPARPVVRLRSNSSRRSAWTSGSPVGRRSWAACSRAR